MDFEVEKGCIFALLGSIGAGQTTIVKILTTPLKQDVGKPQVILLDEPTTGLNPEACIEFQSTVKELVDGGTTVFLTTQYLEEAEQLADQIAILHEGLYC